MSRMLRPDELWISFDQAPATRRIPRREVLLRQGWQPSRRWHKQILRCKKVLMPSLRSALQETEATQAAPAEETTSFHQELQQHVLQTASALRQAFHRQLHYCFATCEDPQERQNIVEELKLARRELFAAVSYLEAFQSKA